MFRQRKSISRPTEKVFDRKVFKVLFVKNIWSFFCLPNCRLWLFASILNVWFLSVGKAARPVWFYTGYSVPVVLNIQQGEFAQCGNQCSSNIKATDGNQECFSLIYHNCKYYTTHLQILTAAINGKNALHKECVLRKLLNLRTTLRENIYAKQIAQ